MSWTGDWSDAAREREPQAAPTQTLNDAPQAGDLAELREVLAYEQRETLLGMQVDQAAAQTGLETRMSDLEEVVWRLASLIPRLVRGYQEDDS